VAISHTELQAWMAVTGIALSRWEQSVIFAIDSVQFASLAEEYTFEGAENAGHGQLSVFEKKPELKRMM
jgi:hypothetical protein